METVAVEVRPPGKEPFPERRHELGAHRRVAMQIAMVGEPGAAPILKVRRQWRIPGVQTRGRGGVPLMEIPARRRLVEQSLAVPLFQNEPPTGDEEIDDPISGSRSSPRCGASTARRRRHRTAPAR